MWTNDERGKPKLWLRVFDSYPEATVGLADLKAELQRMEESSENYIMRREPAIEADYETATFKVVCAVRWVPDQATAERVLDFQNQFEQQAQSDGVHVRRV